MCEDGGAQTDVQADSNVKGLVTDVAETTAQLLPWPTHMLPSEAASEGAENVCCGGVQA